MKKLLIGLTLLASMSSFANDFTESEWAETNCKLFVSGVFGTEGQEAITNNLSGTTFDITHDYNEARFVVDRVKTSHDTVYGGGAFRKNYILTIKDVESDQIGTVTYNKSFSDRSTYKSIMVALSSKIPFGCYPGLDMEDFRSGSFEVQ